MCVLFSLVIDVVEVGPFLGESTALNYIPCQGEMMHPFPRDSLISVTCVILFPVRKDSRTKADLFTAQVCFSDFWPLDAGSCTHRQTIPLRGISSPSLHAFFSSVFVDNLR